LNLLLFEVRGSIDYFLFADKNEAAGAADAAREIIRHV